MKESVGGKRKIRCKWIEYAFNFDPTTCKAELKGNTLVEKRTMQIISRLKKETREANSRGVTVSPPHRRVEQEAI